MEYRIERDALGEVRVPADRLYGPQTQRSVMNFPIGRGLETMPDEIIKAFGMLKKAAAAANAELKPERMTAKKAAAIEEAAQEVIDGKHPEDFPLVVWQTGSGTQSNMNVNEVIAHRANEIAGEKLCHPNDDVNMSQSSNDTFPTAMHVAAVISVEKRLLPALEALENEFRSLSLKYKDVLKCGRTHLMDATPIYFGQELAGYASALATDREMIIASLDKLRRLAIGGTAVGTGLNAPKGFDKAVAAKLSEMAGVELAAAENKCEALWSKNAVCAAHGALKALAADLMKVANDVRWMASGPRNGLAEITIPANEPGSSIMPGKVNPTQCEQVTMVAVQVMGNDAAIGFAASQGNFELNVFMPVIAYNFLQSARLLAESMEAFRERCVCGIEPVEEKMRENVERSLMLVTGLTPYIGYEKAAEAALYAHREKLTLKEACVKLGILTEERFDEVFHPEEMA